MELIRNREVISRNNPWRFGRYQIITCESLYNGGKVGNSDVRIAEVFRKLTQQYNLQTMLYIYFNTLLKTFIPLNALLKVYSEESTFEELSTIWMKEYPLIVTRGVEELVPINFKGHNIYIVSDAGRTKETSLEGKSTYFFKEYILESDTIVLTLKE